MTTPYVPPYPQAPFDAVMPAGPQAIMTWVSAIALTIFALVALRQCLRDRSMLPLLYLVAGFCTILLEPLVTHLGHAVHPEVGQWTLFKTADRAIPWHIALTYSFYFGGVFMVVMPRLFAGTVGAGFVWKSYFFTCALAYAIEIVPVHVGLWVYYDTQPLWLWKGSMPLWWTFVNASCIYFPMAMMLLFQPALRGAGQLLVVPLSIMGANMAHFGAGVFVYNAMNSSAERWVIELAGLASVGAALLIVYACTRIVMFSSARR